MAVVGIEGDIAGQDAQGALAAGSSRHDFDGGDHSAAAMHGGELEMQAPVLGGGDIGEHLDVGGAAAVGVGGDVEIR